jgi:anaphase-promoting complex subunit 8
MQDFGESEPAFEQVTKDHPYCLEGMDVYSNVLYVLDRHKELCDLAHKACKIDMYRPEVSCSNQDLYDPW